MVMNRGLKNRTSMSNAIDNELLRRLKQLSSDTKITQSKLLDEAIRLLLKEYEKVMENTNS